MNKVSASDGVWNRLIVEMLVAIYRNRMLKRFSKWV
jgi:hypothetical protein